MRTIMSMARSVVTRSITLLHKGSQPATYRDFRDNCWCRHCKPDAPVIGLAIANGGVRPAGKRYLQEQTHALISLH